MNGQPQCTLGGAFQRVRHTSRQKYIIAGLKSNDLSTDVEDRFTLHEENPFILRLDVLAGCDGRRADDALHNEVVVAEERIEALSFSRRLCIGEEVVVSHPSMPFRIDRR